MPILKRKLIVCWFGMLATGVGMSRIAPVLRSVEILFNEEG